ncbi:hypothetical protein LVB87_10030 [Lysobacter sp. KIS68-7]|uniref:hypothetical protein n=1 Tax=Lysobacter sp. KIS68-7 TaxID=2904252 RepID=UPI001E2F3FE4|nr:hypothetical protein [Lysobacter sp. KIS68-7]UHQ18547.1 hypothetical protein LVB87_10030 [Lysobacter sp. KIS68-7]
MKYTNFVVAALLCIASASALAAQDANGYKPLHGSYSLASKTLIDPAPTEAKDRMVFFLEGDAAADMFKRLPGPATRDACSDEMTMKQAGGLVCLKDAKGKYTCSFGIIFKTGVLVDATAC